MVTTPITVFISGANGFIAQHVVLLLLDKGYRVVGSVRSIEKGEKLKKELKTDQFTYEIVPSLTEEGAFDEALKKHPEVTVFIHAASPVSFTSDDPKNDVFIPAIKGTVNALSAIKKYAPQVKRVVYTSSVAAIINTSDVGKVGVSFDETDFNKITEEESLSDGRSAYRGSKTYAEKAAWKFMEEEKPNFILSCVNPSMVFGAQAFDQDVKETLNLSAEAVGSLLKLTPESPIPVHHGSYIHVKDVAKAHILAFEKEEAKNKRLLLSNDKYSNQLLINIIRDKFPQLRTQLPVGDPQNLDLEVIPTLINTKTREILGFEFVPLEETVFETIDQILRCRP